MFTIEAVFRVPGKKPYQRTWDGLDKVQVIGDFEMAFNKAMLKMTELSLATATGNAPKPSSTKPADMNLSVQILEDGKRWMACAFDWPKIGEEMQALLIGIVEGELSTMPQSTKGKERRKK
jgi:hypothetical protein